MMCIANKICEIEKGKPYLKCVHDVSEIVDYLELCTMNAIR